MANRNWPNGGKIYMQHYAPCLITCNFIVDSTNGNGFGIRSLKGPGVANVFMNTSATPAGGNPNPNAGYIVVQLEDNYNATMLGMSSITSPTSGSNVTSTTAGIPYVITSLGTTTAAQWVAAGVPSNMLTTNGLPTVGLAFIATATGAIGGTGTVQTTSNSGIETIETIGDPNQSIAPVGTPGSGATVILQCLKNDVLTAPANGTVIALGIMVNNSGTSAGHPSPGG